MAPIAIDSQFSNNSAARAPVTNNNNASAAVPIVDPTAARRPAECVIVDSDNLTYTDEAFVAKYDVHSSQVKKEGDKYRVKPVTKSLELKTIRKVPKTGSVHIPSTTTITDTIVKVLCSSVGAATTEAP